MAKILLGAFMGAISGSVSGTTFSTNRSGAYVKKKNVKKFKPGSDLSETVNLPSSGSVVSSVRARFASISKSWKLISIAKRTAFNNAVADWTQIDALGNTVTLSGFNLFSKLNGTAGALFSLATAPFTAVPITTVPAKIAGNFVQEATLDFTVLKQSFEASGYNGPISNTNAILVEMTRPMSAGVSKPSDSDFRQIAVINAPLVGPATEYDVSDQYAAKMGSIVGAEGKVIFTRLSMVSITGGQKNTFNQFVEKIA